ncbi:MAG: DUF2520 domain-containing protein [Pseudobdellovibrionaceae bacterium]
MLHNQRYCIVGSGRTARHFAHYLNTLGLAASRWDRSQPLTTFHRLLAESTHLLLLISDSAIEGFYREHLAQFKGMVIHFSGALEVPGIESVHPLMTFAEDLYDAETYRKIPFVTTSTRTPAQILPDLPNTIHRISSADKTYYHALCVMSGNFTTLLWQKMSQGLSEIGLPSGIESTYRDQIFKNLSKDLDHALTGPIARRDLATILRNDQALQNDAYRKIYRAFVAVHYPEAFQKIEGAE